VTLRWGSLLQWTIVLGATSVILILGAGSEGPERDPLRQNALRQGLVGCYKVMTDRGHPLGPHDYYGASPMVYLDSTPRLHVLTNGKDLGTSRRLMIRLDSTAQPIEQERRPLAFIGPAWWVDSLDDTVHMSFSNGLSGIALIVGERVGTGDTLRGRIEDHWDFGPPFVAPHGRGMAVRVPCPSS